METITNAKSIHQKSTDKLEVFMFNVGQGDHLMLRFPTGEYGIIDFFFDSKTASEPPCLSYFKSLKNELTDEEFEKITISFFCISHTDKDHVTGVSNTLKWLLENGIFIRNFWFSAAKNEKAYTDFFVKKMKKIATDASLLDRINYFEQIKIYKDELSKFTVEFEKWKKREVASHRYITETNRLGHGEYLFDIKPLMKPCPNSRAHNIGPLYRHLDDFNKISDFDLFYKIFNISDKAPNSDKNDVSHILNIRFGDKSLLFGGDTHLSIWKDCIETYKHPDFGFMDLFGNIESHFIKVSHHGSKNSSSEHLWGEIIDKSADVYFGISAGRHDGYKHPHAETLSHIKQAIETPTILSTNICGTCLEQLKYPSEYYKWYDDLPGLNSMYGKKKANKNDSEIDYVIVEDSKKNNTQDNETNGYGLFAYIFEIPQSQSEKINIRVAYSTRNKQNNCFFENHTEKLNPNCSFTKQQKN